MPSLFKRLNKNGGTLLLGLLFLFPVSGCKKKDRLTSSTFNFTISPPVSTILKTESLSLTAHGSSASGPVAVNPSWTVSPDTAGVLNTALGASVTFTPSGLVDVVISAVAEGVMARSQIAVVTFKTPAAPSAITDNPYYIYSDAGIPSGATLFDNPSGSLVTEQSTGYTPEGIKYQRASNASSGDYWGVGYTTGQNITASAGSLKFSLRLSRAVTISENLQIQITDTTSAKSFNLVSQQNGYTRTTVDTWEEISIPLSSFPGLDLANIKTPFAIVTTSLNSPLTFDIDAVRWEN